MAYLVNRNGIYHIYYYHSAEGKQKSVSTRTKDKVKAKKMLQTFEAKQHLNLLSTDFYTPENNGHTLSQAYKLFLSNNNYPEKTKKLYDSAIRFMVSACGDKLIGKYTNSDYLMLTSYLNTYRFAKKKNPISQADYYSLSVNSKALYTRHLRAFFSWLQKNGLVSNNPIRVIKGEIKEVKAIPVNDLTMMLETIGSDSSFTFLVKFLLLTGMRINEALALKYSDIDLKNAVITLYNQKAKRGDKIPLISEVIALLETYGDKKRENKLFAGYDYYKVRTKWDNINKMLGFSYNIHQLRKTCGTILANSGVSPLFLQKYLRHTNFNTTLSYYIQPDLDKMKKEIEEKANFGIG